MDGGLPHIPAWCTHSLLAVVGSSSCLGTAKEHRGTAEGCCAVIPAHINTWDVPSFSRRMPWVVSDCAGRVSSCKDLKSLFPVRISWQLVEVPLYQASRRSDSRPTGGTAPVISAGLCPFYQPVNSLSPCKSCQQVSSRRVKCFQE